MPCGVAQCRCTAFQPQKWAPTKCHACFHWDHQHDALDTGTHKPIYPPPLKEHATPPPADLPGKPRPVNLTYKYPGLASPTTTATPFTPSTFTATTTTATTAQRSAGPLATTKVLHQSASMKKEIVPTPSQKVASVSAIYNSNISAKREETPPIATITKKHDLEARAKREVEELPLTTKMCPSISTPKDEEQLATTSLQQDVSTKRAPPTPIFTGGLPPAATTGQDPPPKPLRKHAIQAEQLLDMDAFNLDQSRPRCQDNNITTPTEIEEPVGRSRRDNFHNSVDEFSPIPTTQRHLHQRGASSDGSSSGSSGSSSSGGSGSRKSSSSGSRSSNSSGGGSSGYHQRLNHDSSHQRVVSTDSVGKHRSNHQRGSSEFFDESDEDDSVSAKPHLVRQETVASLSSKLSAPFVVVKSNKFGVKQNRVIALDHQALTLKFCDMSLRLKSEVPVSHLTLTISDDNDRKIALSFKQRARVYDLLFETAFDCASFQANLENALTQQAEIQRKEDTALLTSFMENTQNSLEVSQQQEYRVLKKNKFRHKQLRILVLKATGLALLDGDRKFIKSFPYELIYSVETNATEDDKKSAAYEAETFIVFHQAAGQRPFQVFFSDPFDRQLFSQTLRSLHRKLVIKDGDHPSSARFIVTKSDTATPQKGTHRILEILASDSALRAYDRLFQFKDTPFSAVRSIEACVVDNKRVYFEVQKNKRVKRFAFDFTDSVSRARFLAMSTFALDSQRTIPPGMKISIFCGTWNVGGSSPSEEFFFLDQFIKSDSYDIYAIALQECPQGKRDDWVVEIQRHCGGHSRDFTGLSPADRKAQTKYEIVASSKLWEISVLILVRAELAYKVTGVSEATVACGMADVLGNKGAAAAFFRYEDTSLGFVACHLAARAERVKERRQDFLKIVKGIRLGDREVDIVNSCDHLFWFGDLNYRVEKGFHETIAAVEAKNYAELAACDQLRREMAKGPKELVFPGFREGTLGFAPTYRWEKSRNQFSNKREQAPSYTDRVLWHTLQEQCIALQSYSSAPDVLGSDHRPCYATFTLSPRSFLWSGRESSLEVVLKPLNLSAEEPEFACLRLVVTAPFIREQDAWPLALREAGALKWSWADGVHVRAYVEKDHLSQQHLLVCVQAAQTQECVGYTTVPLAMHESRFRTQLTKDGVMLGWLNGTLSVYVTPEESSGEKIARRHALADGSVVD